MTRDLDFVREILLRVESLPYGDEIEGMVDIETPYTGDDFLGPMPDDEPSDTLDPFFGRDQATAAGHVHLLFESGFIGGRPMRSRDGLVDGWTIQRLTVDGHDFLDSVRDPAVYRETKSQLKKVGGSAALEVVKAVAQTVTMSMLGLQGLGPA